MILIGDQTILTIEVLQQLPSAMKQNKEEERVLCRSRQQLLLKIRSFYSSSKNNFTALDVELDETYTTSSNIFVVS